MHKILNPYALTGEADGYKSELSVAGYTTTVASNGLPHIGSMSQSNTLTCKQQGNKFPNLFINAFLLYGVASAIILIDFLH
jgi:hypothetical protein